ncbi:MAG: AMP-binding protein [Bryobacteraceae bacterium]
MRTGGGFVAFARSEIQQSIPARWRAQVRQHGESLAVSAGGVSVSYRDLDQLSDRFAHAVLSAAGEAPQPIALLMDQSVLLPAAILGVLKAGHFYVPFDRGIAPARIARMLEHAGAATLITDRASSAIASGLSAKLVEAESIANEAHPGSIDRSGDPDALAYVYYTSGSTGEPKGVMDNHRNVLHNVLRYTNALGIGPSDRLTLLQTASFSGAVSSMFCALLNGAASFPILARGETPGALAHWVRSNELTMWHSVPALFRHLCASGERFPSVRVVRLEGDQAAPSDVTLFRRCFSGDSVLVNGLGATETGITRQFFVTASTAIPERSLPIGYPVEDMDAQLLDAEDGVGEIGIKSRYLALGYWKQPESTARAFHDCDGGKRLYRTGDLGRMHDDGCLEHLGRKDLAFKIHGNRVDAGEVEAALCTLPGVEQAAVAPRANERGEPRLCAWLICKPGYQLDPGRLRRELAGRLPLHAVPSWYALADAFPLNANGKIDRSALPAPSRGRPSLAVPMIDPETATEREIARVWREVLDLDEIGIDDDFFDLGGTSLDVARVVAELGIDVEAFVSGPTIRRMAGFRSASGVITIRRGDGQPPLFCAPPHSGLLVGYQNLARHLVPGRAIFGFSPPGANVPVPVRDLAIRNIEAMREVQPHGPYAISGYCFGGLVAWEMASLLEQAGERVSILVLVECYFDGWLREQSAARRASVVFEHAVRRALRHVTRGPLHWAALVRRVSELRDERDWVMPYRDATSSFRPLPFSGRVLLLQPESPRAGEYPAPLMGWDRLITGPVEHHTLPDDLQSLLSEPTVSRVARLVEQALA